MPIKDNKHHVHAVKSQLKSKLDFWYLYLRIQESRWKKKIALITLERRQSKKTIKNQRMGIKTRQKQWFWSPIESSVSNDFWSVFVESINGFDCHVSGVLIFHVLIKYNTGAVGFHSDGLSRTVYGFIHYVIVHFVLGC